MSDERCVETMPSEMPACTCTKLPGLAPLVRFGCPVHAPDPGPRMDPADQVLDPGIPVILLEGEPAPIQMRYLVNEKTNERFGAARVYVEVPEGWKFPAIAVEANGEKSITPPVHAMTWLVEHGLAPGKAAQLLMEMMGFNTRIPQEEATHIKHSLEYSEDTRGVLRIYLFNERGQHRGMQQFARSPASPSVMGWEAACTMTIASMIPGLEVRITNENGGLVYHAIGGEVLFPNDAAEFWRTAGGPREEERSITDG